RMILFHGVNQFIDTPKISMPVFGKRTETDQAERQNRDKLFHTTFDFKFSIPVDVQIGVGCLLSFSSCFEVLQTFSSEESGLKGIVFWKGACNRRHTDALVL